MQRYGRVNTIATWGAFVRALRRHIHTDTQRNTQTHRAMWDKQYIHCKLPSLLEEIVLMKQQWHTNTGTKCSTVVQFPDSRKFGSCFCFGTQLFWEMVACCCFPLSGEASTVWCVWVCVMAVFLYRTPVWSPGVEAKVECLSDGISQPPSAQRPAEPQALTFTRTGPLRPSETPEWQTHLSPWRAEAGKNKNEIKGRVL